MGTLCINVHVFYCFFHDLTHCLLPLQLFTAASSFSYGLLEQDVSARGRLTHPHLYKTSQQGKYFNSYVRSSRHLKDSHLTSFEFLIDQ